jgi:transposase InsO family protein
MIETAVLRSWWTAAELAAARLPGLPSAKRKVNLRADAERWALKHCTATGNPLARTRKGRGGGVEYHVDLLPAAARAELVRRGLAQGARCDAAPVPANDEAAASPAAAAASLWAWFERQPDSAKATARRRLAAVEAVERLRRAGASGTAAVAQAAADAGTSTSTLWEWLAAAGDPGSGDRLARLAPRSRGGGRTAEMDDLVWQAFKSDWLRPERPTMAHAFRVAKQVAAANGLAVPHLKTLQRRMDRDVPLAVQVLKRRGEDALRDMIPAQQRSVLELHAGQAVNVDGHTWDVFVKTPDGRTVRPVMVAIQDLYSRRFLAWRIGETESAVLTRLAFADLIADVGVPQGVLMDNGRAFASKWISGGAKTRYRFKVREEEPLGILALLGIDIHWARPYAGQSKPIERGFRDLCNEVAKNLHLAGAWTGNRPDNKPANYGSKEIDWDVFVGVVNAGIAEHNARTRRDTETAQGRYSFDEVFAASYAASPVGKATPAQLRLALLAADQVRADRETGAVSVFGNSYWSPELARVAGQRVTVRFDPDRLHDDVHVYDERGDYVASAPVWQKTGFFDAEAARRTAKMHADYKRAAKRAAELERLLTPAELAAMLPTAPMPVMTPSNVARPIRPRGGAAQALAPVIDIPAPAPLAVAPESERFAAAIGRHLRLVED